MAGFHVANGSYSNKIAPNPSCCTDPSVLCVRCARLVLNATMDDEDESFTTNCGEDNDTLPLPGTMEQVVNARRQETAKQTVNGRNQSRRADDDDTLPLPVYNWSEMSGIGRK